MSTENQIQFKKWEKEGDLLTGTLESFVDTTTGIAMKIQDSKKGLIYIGLTLGLKRLVYAALKNNLKQGQKVIVKYLDTVITENNNNFQNFLFSFVDGERELTFSTKEYIPLSFEYTKERLKMELSK